MRQFYAERDDEFPRWNYPWDEMTQPGDFFEMRKTDFDAGRGKYRLQTVIRNANVRKKNADKRFILMEAGDKFIVKRVV
jgi:hypothetical protein